MRYTYRGIQQAQIVINLGDCAYSRARITRRSLLFDGNGWTESVNGVHFWPLHLVEKLAGIRGKRFDIPALTFGVDGVERQGRLPGSA